MSVILIIVIIIIILFKYSKNKIENFSNHTNIVHHRNIHKKKENNNKLKSINEYTRQDLPRYLKIEVFNAVNKNILNKYKNRLTIIDIDHLKITNYPGSANYYVEVFILDNTLYTTNKFIINYTIKNGGVFQLNDMRIYSFKDDKVILNSNIYGIHRNNVEGRKNLTNPYIDNSLNPTIQNIFKTSLEYTDLQKELNYEVNKNILDKDIEKFNSTILPKHIVDKSLYMTMTPDFFNINVYPVDINNDIFSRTRGIISFPTGKSI
jgi:hypothetical protein